MFRVQTRAFYFCAVLEVTFRSQHISVVCCPPLLIVRDRISFGVGFTRIYDIKSILTLRLVSLRRCGRG